MSVNHPTIHLGQREILTSMSGVSVEGKDSFFNGVFVQFERLVRPSRPLSTLVCLEVAELRADTRLGPGIPNSKLYAPKV